MKKTIGIVVGNYFKVPHETEQINAQMMMRELEALGRPAHIFYFNGDFSGKGVSKFSEFSKTEIDEVYLSGKISNKNFAKLILSCFMRRRKIHFRIPSYRLDLFKKYRFFLSFFIRRGTLQMYSYDSVHQRFIKKELGFETKVLEPLASLDSKVSARLKKEFDILFVGSLNDLKRGLKDLVAAMVIIKKSFPKVKLKVISRYEVYTKKKDWFAGFEGKDVDIVKSVKDSVKENGLEDNVIFSGKVKNVGEEYGKAKVYVLPLKYFDMVPPIPFTILESLYHGTPVVSKDFWGIGLILDKQFLVGKDLKGLELAKELANKIVGVLKDKPKVSLDKRFTSKEAVKKFLSYVDET